MERSENDVEDMNLKLQDALDQLRRCKLTFQSEEQKLKAREIEYERLLDERDLHENKFFSEIQLKFEQQ